ncbi:hypothetical protein GCM10011533_30060 [Streptosporangium jomthongense]|uniref:HNH endonuclease signature motif containing protein n=1 Tax=Marinobacter aromaticivorans TaxID=1494078 RepID=A0ABW2IYT9_9GAMM|nr:HNH endonuclease signature motif containing protein [Marinobacter aromaticivorans]GGE75699.1 hypothetical protein GCM10011533_30060 [Streptosporangium jomthongense]
MGARTNSAVWTAQQDQWLRELYPHTSNRKIAKLLGRTYASIKNRGRVLGLKKSSEYLAAEKPGCFRKGHNTWNKGANFVSGGRSIETRFKPGNLPQNHQPVGTEIIDTYGYRKRKVRDDAPKGQSYKNWRFVHVIVWEEHNGPLPKGHIVRFRDMDITNIAPDNLVAVTRGENAVINRWMAMGSLPEGGMDVLITMARLKMVARKRKEELA